MFIFTYTDQILLENEQFNRRRPARSFLWCFECYAGLTSGECMANGLTNVIRHQFAMIAK